MPTPKKTIKKTATPQNEEILAALEQYFGFSEFKGTQEQAILSLLSGRDTFVIMPTGGGKSLCYQFASDDARRLRHRCIPFDSLNEESSRSY